MLLDVDSAEGLGLVSVGRDSGKPVVYDGLVVEEAVGLELLVGLDVVEAVRLVVSSSLAGIVVGWQGA